jgi:hypothetical protein
MEVTKENEYTTSFVKGGSHIHFSEHPLKAAVLHGAIRGEELPQPIMQDTCMAHLLSVMHSFYSYVCILICEMCCNTFTSIYLNFSA